jgi:hypothetical protein
MYCGQFLSTDGTQVTILVITSLEFPVETVWFFGKETVRKSLSSAKILRMTMEHLVKGFIKIGATVEPGFVDHFRNTQGGVPD